LTEYVLACVTN